jgi:hypothetical protein
MAALWIPMARATTGEEDRVGPGSRVLGGGDPRGFRSEQEQRLDKQRARDGARPGCAFRNIAADEGAQGNAGHITCDGDERVHDVALSVKEGDTKQTVLPVMLATKEWARPK